MPKPKEPVTLSINRALAAALRRHHLETGRPMSVTVEDALREFFEREQFEVIPHLGNDYPPQTPQSIATGTHGPPSKPKK